MPSTDRYSYENLDDDGHWIHDTPTDLASTGLVFEQSCCSAPTLSPGNNAVTDRFHHYPDLTTRLNANSGPYFMDSKQSQSVKASSSRTHPNLNPKAPPFSPAPAPSRSHAQEVPKSGRRVLCTRDSRGVFQDNAHAEASAAARRASSQLSTSLRRRSSAKAPPLQRPPPPGPVYGVAGAPALETRTISYSQNLTAYPLSVPDWAANQTAAFHPGVGTVQMSIPQGPNSVDSTPVQSTNPSASAVTEPYPCLYEDCTSEHKPFMTKSARDKHMKCHAPKHQLRYHCELCSYHCRYPRELERHRSVHFPDENEDTQQCPFCQTTFGKRKDNLDRHFKTCKARRAVMNPPFGLATPSPRTRSDSFTSDRSQFPPLPPTPSSSIRR